MILLKEHQKIDPDLLADVSLDDLRCRISYDTRRFEPSKINLIRYEFDPAAGRDGFYSYYRIGAEWIDSAQSRSLIVTPKIQNIDFLEIFMTCLSTAESNDSFSDIYDIDFEARPVRSRSLSSILSPLLVVQLLMAVSRIVSRGLRRGYVSRAGNLPKVKGRVDIRRNERLNIITGHRERVFCRYDEYSADIPENRVLKRALHIARDMIALMRDHRVYSTLAAMCNRCISAFSCVSDSFDCKMPVVKSNKLYRDYSDALRIAAMVLRRQDIAISRHDNQPDEYVPVFRIDMALLFEHYALAVMRRTFSRRAVQYQVAGYGGRFVADFLLDTGRHRAIVDTKYIDGISATVAKADYIKQLSAYARDKRLLRALGYDTTDDTTLPIVPCILIYPVTSHTVLDADTLFNHPVKETVNFYTCPLSIPVIR